MKWVNGVNVLYLETGRQIHPENLPTCHVEILFAAQYHEKETPLHLGAVQVDWRFKDRVYKFGALEGEGRHNWV